MNIERKYIIMEHFNLPWNRVSPANYRGLDYHLTPELTIRLEGIYHSVMKVDENELPKENPRELEFLIGEEIFMTYDGGFPEAGGLNAERTFMNEIMPLKSQERINKAFADKSGEMSVFFTAKQMEDLNHLFETMFFICHNVTVLYCGRELTDICELPKKEFNLAVEAFSELNVQATLDYKKSKEEIEHGYETYYAKKVASEDEKMRTSLWEKVSHKDARKNVLKTFGALAIGSASWLIKRKLAESGGVAGAIVGAVIGAVGILFELYGRNQAHNVLRIF